MCILFLALGGAGDRFRLVLANNRDEFLDRPTRPAQFLRELDARILAPVDLGYIPTTTPGAHRFHGHGTWVGLTTHGRFAVLTNFRENPKDTRADALSRGYICRDYLLGGRHLKVPEDAELPVIGDNGTANGNGNGSGNGNGNGTNGHHANGHSSDSDDEDGLMSPEEYAHFLDKHRELYNGYSVILGDLRGEKPEMWYYSNRDGVKPTRIGPELASATLLASDPDASEPGVAIGLSNATLFDTRWPKVNVGRKVFADSVSTYRVDPEMGEEELIKHLFELLSKTDTLPPPPHTPWDPDMSTGLSSICIKDASWRKGYATRTQTVILVDSDFNATYIERDRNVEQEVQDDKSTTETTKWTAERRFNFQIQQ